MDKVVHLFLGGTYYINFKHFVPLDANEEFNDAFWNK